jgi:hypothetical protein
MLPQNVTTNRNKRKKTYIKRYIKLLAVNQDPVLNLSLLKAAPDAVIKTLCNAAYNLTNGSVRLTNNQKRFFRKYKIPITELVQPATSIRRKRNLLVQRGGGFFIPALLTAVLPIVTTLLSDVLLSKR